MDADKNCSATFNTVEITGAVQEEYKIRGGGGCFIATAAFGSYLDPRVQTLRSFRDNFLLKSSLGQTFVNFYYQVSPPIAEYITRHEHFKNSHPMGLNPCNLCFAIPWDCSSTSLGAGSCSSGRKRLKKNIASLNPGQPPGSRASYGSPRAYI